MRAKERNRKLENMRQDSENYLCKHAPSLILSIGFNTGFVHTLSRILLTEHPSRNQHRTAYNKMAHLILDAYPGLAS